MNNNLVSLNLNSTKNSALQKNSTVSSNIVNLNLLDVAYTQGTKSNFQADLNNLDLKEEEYTFEELMEYAEKQLENMKAASRVETVVNNIGDIDPNDLDDIQRALSMYNSLTDEQKRCVSSEAKEKLENAIKDYNESVNKASEVIDAINNIGEIDFNSKDKIDEVLNLYNSLTDEQKSFLSPEVVEMINSLEKVSKQIEDTQSKINELENLYSEREDNNGFWHPIKESEIEERIKELEKELGVPHQPDEWEKIWDDPGAALATFGVSVLEGFVDLGEGLVDGVFYSIAKSLQVFGVDDKWAEDIISYDVSGNMYDSFVDASGIDPEIAYGMMHSAGNFVGEMAGYYALSAIPYAGPALCAVAGAGSAVEDSINRQLEDSGTVNDWVVFGESALGALEGYGFGKAGKAAHQGINALKDLGIDGTKKLAQTNLSKFGKDVFLNTMKDGGKQLLKQTALNTLTDADTWVETGTVVLDNVVTGMETGEWDFGRMASETAVVFGGNFIGNLGGNYLNLANDAKMAGTSADSWKSNDGITDEMAQIAENNYRSNSGDFTSKAAYYSDLDYVEKNSSYSYKNEDGIWVGDDKRIPRGDPGITKCLTTERVQNWNAEVDLYPGSMPNTTRVHVGNTNEWVFDNVIIGSVDDGFSGTSLGRAGDYQFASLGTTDTTKLLNGEIKNPVHQFQTDLGLEKTDAKRVFLYDYDIPRDSAQMPTGCELGSNNQRIPGGRTPNGELELVHEAIGIDSSVAASSNVVILDTNGNVKFSGSIQDLRDMKADPTRIREYYDIIGGSL